MRPNIGRRIRQCIHALKFSFSIEGLDLVWAESYFNRLRRDEMGHFHHVSGPYLFRYAQEAS
jgi:hypothetical protein